MSDFDVEAFLFNPSWEKIDLCRKQDLLDIAAHLGVTLSKVLKLSELKETVIQVLVEHKYLGATDVDVASPFLAGSEEEKEEVRPGLSRPPEVKPTFTTLIGGSGDPKYDLELARLNIEAREREQERDYAHQLAMKSMELEREIQLKRLELELSARREDKPSGFNVGQNLVLVTQFRETEVEAWFHAFERIAKSHKWPSEVWALVLQSKLTGKAQEALGTLSIDDSLDYDKIKAAVLRVYELVPEAYRQKFRNHKTKSNQTVAEFGREKEVYFKRWCDVSKANTFESLSELILIEELKNCLPDRLVTYLNERKASTLAEATVFADEYLLTHKHTFSDARSDKRGSPQFTPTSKFTAPSSTSSSSSAHYNSVREIRKCNYCHRVGHLKADCFMLKRQQENKA